MTMDRNTLLENVLSEFDEPLTKKDVRRLFAALAAELPEEPAVVWSEPRQMWNGQWYRVGSSTGANVPAQPDTVCVPREPTPEMIQAMEDRMVEGASYIAENSIQYALWKEVYRAMLAAAGGKR